MNSLVNRIGLSSKLLLGYAGVLIFMMGEGLEQGWLSPYLISKGLTVQESALLFSVYGFSAAIAAWLSVAARNQNPSDSQSAQISAHINCK